MYTHKDASPLPGHLIDPVVHFTQASSVPHRLIQPTHCSGRILVPVMITMINVLIPSDLFSLTEYADNC